MSKKKAKPTPVKAGDVWVHPRLADLLFGRVKEEETGRTRDSRYLDIAAQALDKPIAKKPRPKRNLKKNVM